MSTINVRINGKDQTVASGVSVAAAILNAGETRFRQSVEGVPRGPVCGMGICYECRVTIDGQFHLRSCTIACEEGMVIETEV